jgi:hypothetical protein
VQSSSFVQIFALDTPRQPINRGQKVQLFSLKHIRVASLTISSTIRIQLRAFIIDKILSRREKLFKKFR